MADTLLDVENLSLQIGDTPILKDISLQMKPGRIMGMVGESGSGKSMTALSIMQLLPRGSSLTGRIGFDGQNLLEKSEAQMCHLRGDDLAMIFQEPMTALNPVQTIGDQIIEGINLHRNVSRQEALEITRAILARVGLPVSQIPLSRYPFELSGGQRQRVMIAMACAMRPKLLIADEPTTALDVSVQARILDLLQGLVEDFGMGLLLITHDLGVVADIADDICILRDGEIMEQGDALSVLRRQSHPYTRQLAEASSHQPSRTLEAVTHESASGQKTKPLLTVENLNCTYPGVRTTLFGKPEPFAAVDGVSIQIYPRQIMGLVGESGCGKSTFARALMGLKAPAKGNIHFAGERLNHADHGSVARLRQNIGVVFQDPYGSFNPRHKVDRIIAEPLHLRQGLSKAEQQEKVEHSLLSVGLSLADASKYPHEFSGGQRQRIAIARALITNPKMIIADEPVSALDVSIRAQILDLLVELNENHEIAYLFISHDLSVVRSFCDEVAVMKSGKIVEQGIAKDVFSNPKDSYTKMLIDAAPDLAKTLAA